MKKALIIFGLVGALVCTSIETSQNPPKKPNVITPEQQSKLDRLLNELLSRKDFMDIEGGKEVFVDNFFYEKRQTKKQDFLHNQYCKHLRYFDPNPSYPQLKTTPPRHWWKPCCNLASDLNLLILHSWNAFADFPKYYYEWYCDYRHTKQQQKKYEKHIRYAQNKIESLLSSKESKYTEV